MKKYFTLLFIISPLLSIDLSIYECNTSKLSNISSNRVLTTLKALGYTTIEHHNVYVNDEWTHNLQPNEVNIDEDESLFIIDIPDSQSSSLGGSSKDGDDDDEISQFLYGVSMDSSTDSDPVERIMVCYDKNQPNVYREFLDILYNKLDVPAKQILIEALIIEINSEDLKDSGISANYLNTDDNISISTPFGGDPLSIIYSENSFTETLVDLSGAIINSDSTNYAKAILEDNLEIKIKALITAKSAEILSRPSILVLDGRQARIQVGQQIPITKLPVSSYSGEGILIPDIEYLPVGIVLNIKPRISNDLKKVTMQIETIITETDNFSAGVLEAPIINNRKVETYVRVSDNTPFIIGGLISNKKSNNEGKIPLLSKIPWLGKLFTWKGKQNVKKEVIVVITPHIIEDNSENFSRVIPQDALIFDSFGNKLFPNSYRLKESDIFDLDFITSSDYLSITRAKSLNSYLNLTKEQKYIKDQIINGFIPGENIITQRMIYEIIDNQNYFESINSDEIIFFNHDKNNKVDFIKNYFPTINDPRRGILLSINISSAEEDSFFRPSMIIEEIVLTEDYNYKESFQNYRLSKPESKPILITNQKHLKRLYEVLVLREVLKLNQTLDLSINKFKRGLEVQFPSKEIIMENSFIIDEQIADYFYQVNFYYESFEKEFKDKTGFLIK
jgi:general secretion pathway protein D